jgi:hypothetical protein
MESAVALAEEYTDAVLRVSSQVGNPVAVEVRDSWDGDRVSV